MRTTQKLTVGAGVVVALVTAFFAVPEEVAAQELTQVYELEAKQGAQQALESALRRHSQWREENGDPWEWNIYQVVEGENHGMYMIRSGDHSWEDFDAYWQGFGAKANHHYNAVVAPVVESTKSYIAEIDTAASKFSDEETDYSLFSVNTYKLKPGHGEDWVAAVDSIHAAMDEADYPGSAYVFDMVTGAYDSDVRLVFPNENWAGFEGPDQSAYEVVAEVYGEETASEIFDQFGNSFRTYENMVLRSRPDLAVEASDEGGGQ